MFFRSGAELVPSLSTGQIDVAAASPGAALYNAIAQGANATIVGDYRVLEPNRRAGSSNGIAVRKDLIDSGKFQTAKDAKGVTVAITARGQVTDLFAQAFLQTGGLTPKAVRIVSMRYPDMLAAFQGKAIDVAVFTDPFFAIAERDGLAVRLVDMVALMPGLNLGVIMYGDKLGKKNRDLGMRFMRGFHRANLELRRLLGTPDGRREVARIYQKYIPLEDAAMYEKVGHGTAHPSLVTNLAGNYGLRWQLQRYIEAGLIQGKPDLDAAIDSSFAEAALNAVPPQ